MPVREIHARLKDARKKAGLKVPQAAERLKVTEATIRHNENGTRLPSLQMIIEYALLYKCSLDILCVGRPIGAKTPQEPDELSELWSRLDARDRKRVLNLMRDMADDAA